MVSNGVSSSPNPSDYFNVSSGSSLMANLQAASGESVQPFRATPLAPPTFGSSLARPDTPYNLGIGRGSDFRPAHERFSVASATELMASVRETSRLNFSDRFTQIKTPAPELAALNLAVDLTPLHPVSIAIDLGRGVHDIGKAVETSRQDGISKLEAGICKAANVAVETGIIAAGAEVLLFGVPATLALGVANPPLGAAAAATAVVALPEASSNLLRLGTAAGEITEERCHQLFSGNR